MPTTMVPSPSGRAHWCTAEYLRSLGAWDIRVSSGVSWGLGRKVFEAHRQIDGAYIFGQAADRNAIDTGFGNRPYGLKADATGSFQLGIYAGLGSPGIAMGNALTHHGQVKIVEQQKVGTGR